MFPIPRYLLLQSGIRPEDDDRGPERRERETRAKMKRIPRNQGDFASLEERHILYGARGTVEKPVLVESPYPSRIVGCQGSEDTQVHDLKVPPFTLIFGSSISLQLLFLIIFSGTW